MSFSSPLGGLIGNADLMRTRPPLGRERIRSADVFTLNSASDAGLELIHRLFQAGHDVVQGTTLKARTFSAQEVSDNSPELLLRNSSTRPLRLQESTGGGLSFLEDLIGTLEAPTDWAANHDYYLYGSQLGHEQ
jgi:hypothetical protein